MLAEEWQHFGCEALVDRTDVVARVDLEGVGHAIAGQYLIQRTDRVRDADVPIPSVEGDRGIGLECGQILIDHGERRIRRPFGDDLRYRLAIGHGQVEIPGRVTRVG